MFQVIVSFRQRDEGGNEQAYEAVKIVDGVCFERSGTPPLGGGRLRFWHPDAPAILWTADVVPNTDGTSVLYAAPGAEWVDGEMMLTPLLAYHSQSAFVNHLVDMEFEVRPKQ